MTDERKTELDELIMDLVAISEHPSQQRGPVSLSLDGVELLLEALGAKVVYKPRGMSKREVACG